jgi:hypothetical protein
MLGYAALLVVGCWFTTSAACCLRQSYMASSGVVPQPVALESRTLARHPLRNCFR